MVELIEIQRTLRPIRSRMKSLSKSLDFPSISKPAVKATFSQKTFPSVKSKKLHSTDLMHFKKLALEYPNLPQALLRHTLYFRCFFRDVLEKYYRQVGDSQGYSLPTMAQLSCFTIGDQMELIDELDEQLSIYEFIPLHYRHFVLVQHLVCLAIDHVCVPHLMEEIIRVFIDYDAAHHCICLIKHALSISMEMQSLQYYHSLSQRLCMESRFWAMLVDPCNKDRDNLYKFIHSSNRTLLEFKFPVIISVLSSLFESSIEFELSHQISQWVYTTITQVLKHGNRVMVSRLTNLVTTFPSLSETHPEAFCTLNLFVFYTTNEFVKKFKFQDYYRPFIYACFAPWFLQLVRKLHQHDYINEALSLINYYLDRETSNTNNSFYKLKFDIEKSLPSTRKPRVIDSQGDEWFDDALATKTPYSGIELFSPHKSSSHPDNKDWLLCETSVLHVEDSTSNIYPDSALLSEYDEFSSQNEHMSLKRQKINSSPKSGLGLFENF